MALTGNALGQHEEMTLAVRRERVVEYAVQGYTVREIAAMPEFSVSHTTIHRDIKAYLKKQAKWAAENIPIFRELLNERYARLFQKHFELALQGDDRATQNALRIMKAQRELYALDEAPSGDATTPPNGKNVPAFSVTIHETNVLAVGAPGHGNGQAEAPQEGRVITVDVPGLEDASTQDTA